MPRAQPILGRYQACHRCRKKKLKWWSRLTLSLLIAESANQAAYSDAQTPCGACVRSHAFAVKHKTPEAFEPLECLYDDPEEFSEGLKGKIERLESRIEELEEEIRQKDAELDKCICGRSSRAVSENSDFTGGVTPATALVPTFQIDSTSTSTSPSRTAEPDLFGPILEIGSDKIQQSVTQRVPDLILEATPTFAAFTPGRQSSPTIPEFDPLNFRLMNFLWPINLPPPDVLQYLVDTFFASVPLATRLIHKPSFMTSLLQPPNSIDFPHVCLLHAICGVASLYTPIDKDVPTNVIFGRIHTIFFNCGIFPVRYGPWDQGQQYTPMKLEDVTSRPAMGFGEAHIRWAASTFKVAAHLADRLVQVMQAPIVCTWYHYSMGLYMSLHGWLSLIGRALSPMGYHISPGFEPLSRFKPQKFALPREPHKRHLRETPRNLYWIAFSMERVCTITTTWPMSMSEEDSTQTMPVRLQDFMDLVDVPNGRRQRIDSSDFFTKHLPEVTDPFTLYIKGAVLLGKVKVFNARYRKRHDADGVEIDPRDSSEFQMLDHKILSFFESIPKEFKDPASCGVEGKFDPVLYQAHLLPHLAIIILHDPHADLSSPNCFSARKLTAAAHAILDLIFKLCATSFDLIYLDHASSISWLVAGTVLIRLLKVATVNGQVEEAKRLKEEVDVIRFVLVSLGQRVTIGVRQSELLDDFYAIEMKERPTAVLLNGPFLGGGAVLENM